MLRVRFCEKEYVSFYCRIELFCEFVRSFNEMSIFSKGLLSCVGVNALVDS